MGPRSHAQDPAPLAGARALERRRRAPCGCAAVRERRGARLPPNCQGTGPPGAPSAASSRHPWWRSASQCRQKGRKRRAPARRRRSRGGPRWRAKGPPPGQSAVPCPFARRGAACCRRRALHAQKLESDLAPVTRALVQLAAGRLAAGRRARKVGLRRKRGCARGGPLRFLKSADFLALQNIKSRAGRDRKQKVTRSHASQIINNRTRNVDKLPSPASLHDHIKGRPEKNADIDIDELIIFGEKFVKSHAPTSE